MPRIFDFGTLCGVLGSQSESPGLKCFWLTGYFDDGITHLRSCSLRVGARANLSDRYYELAAFGRAIFASRRRVVAAFAAQFRQHSLSAQIHDPELNNH